MHKKLCAQKILKVLTEKGLIDPQAAAAAQPDLVQVSAEVGEVLLAQNINPKDVRDHGFGSLTGVGTGFLQPLAIIAAANAPAAGRGGGKGGKSGGRGRS